MKSKLETVLEHFVNGNKLILPIKGVRLSLLKKKTKDSDIR